MNEREQRAGAKRFVEFWQGKGDEKGQSQPFWLSLLRDVLGVERPESFIEFEDRVFLGHTSFIDGYIPVTKVLIEQKKLGANLNAAIRQSDGALLSPFQQAKRYSADLPFSRRPRWIVTCNFESFNVYDMERPNGEPETIYLKDLEREYYRLQFLVDVQNERLKREMEISIQAGDLVGVLYDLLIKQYKDPTDPFSLRSLNMLCVRLVFCLYAEDAGVFGKRNMFHDYMAQFDVRNFRRGIIDLFQVLDERPEDRDRYLPDDLAAFPYVNGGLFADENVEIPNFTEEIRDVILSKASDDFDWSQISPTIFGAVFESTLNPETRRSGGMHYTSIENIHRVIDPLFLDDLAREIAEIREEPVVKTRVQRARAFQQKLATLKFLDPACGSGNFLTETYLSLRRLENQALSIIYRDQGVFGAVMEPIQVSIEQFYGIEINDFAVTVAKTALWIAESQMMEETAKIAHLELDFLPLKTSAAIVEGNALTIDWNDVCPKEELAYIMGNPPFVGARLMNKEQKRDVLDVFGEKWKNVGDLDYVACWYKKSVEFMQGTSIRAALVSTNSVSQGATVANLWPPLFEIGTHIDFAHRTFRWDSESNSKAHVHCVIVGFSCAPNDRQRVIYTSDRALVVDRINAYLADADDVWIESRLHPICKVPEIGIGNMPIDDGNYLFTRDEKDAFVAIEPSAEEFFHEWYGAQEFIKQKPRYCLYLGNCPPGTLRKLPECMKRVEAVREFRLKSTRSSTLKLADYPTAFGTTNIPKTNYIIIPRVSSERRKYIPMGFLPPGALTSDSAHIIPNATLYHFGVLMSNVHMAWTRAVCGRLKSDYRYSKDIVYNNFVWPNPTPEQKAAIEQTAQGILDARALYPDSSLADLYDDLTMPKELRAAHQANDRAVMAAYGFNVKETTESACVAALMKMYGEAMGSLER